ncbi:gliding motility-associated C-terminal domain-containing protein [Sediminibacter sp. Hel_I_10]|uniref:T9SS type B sorting domain-containing protein n=1 Tax=Sediminibacter sp. Hel_I_10 TaxID=1392490 RepID=UPI00047928BD|nr:gliding motility-associated C-terminal domain-containing protein [Sediminibacter sp. Hel_I_10]
MLKQIKYLGIIFCFITLSSCGDDDRDQLDEVQDVFEDCCSPDPVYGPNVDNLDQSAGEIAVDNLFTPNGDGYQDYLGIENIELYDNHTVSIFDFEDNLIFENAAYGTDGELFPIEAQNQSLPYPDGTYKYKIIVENEQTFLKSGTFCLFTNNPVLEEQNFSECDPLDDGFDPIITGL